MNNKPTTYILEQLLTRTGDQLLLPGGAVWWVSDQRCDCGDDNGIRYEGYHSDCIVTCDACGTDI